MRHLLRVQQSPPGYPPSRLLIIVDGQLIGSPACSAALALLVIFRRTRVLRKCRKGECPGGNRNVRSFQRGQCQFHGVLMLSTESVDHVYYGRARRG